MKNQRLYNFIKWLTAEDRQNWEIERYFEDTIQETEKEEKEHQFDLLMACLPKDAENLASLTPDQAKRLIDCFIKRHPWD